MNRFREGMRRLSSRMTSYAGETFSFHRPGRESVPVDGWRAGQLSDAGSGDVPIDSQDHDLCFKASELAKMAGGLPQRGDWFIDSEGEQYNVVPVDRDRCWRKLDTFGEGYRIHTQLARTKCEADDDE
jgi:hypothetical protein